MNVSKNIATQIRNLYFGKNWTAATFEAHLRDVTWEEATAQVGELNSIATLVHHSAYYMRVQMSVLEGGALDASDKQSFVYPAIENEVVWQAVLVDTYALAKAYAAQVEQLPDAIWEQDFGAQKYGSYYRNIQGVVEHSHYHLGQIVLLKKWLRSQGS